MKSKLPYVFLSFFIASAGSLALASPAQAATCCNPQPITVCGDSATWYVNWDEWDKNDGDNQGDRRPLATRDGLLFYPTDLIHHALDFQITPDLVAGGYTVFPGSPSPDLPDFFSVEVVNDDHTGYATLRWDESSGGRWEVTAKNSGNTETHTNTNPVTVLNSFSPALSLHGRSFGVGYTNNPAGTVASLVTSISFMNTVYKLSCSIAASPSPVMVPGPAKTVIKTVTVTPDFGLSDLSPSPSHASSDQPTVSTQDPSPSSDPKMVSASDTSTLVGYGIATVGIVGVTLVILGVAGIARKRRAPGRHSVDNSETTVISPIYGDDDYDMTDYGPSAPYDPSLGGYAGESRRLDQGDDTEPQPPVE